MQNFWFKPLAVLCICLSTSFMHDDVKALKKLTRVSYYPKEFQDYYFRPIIDIATIGKFIFAVENWRNKVIALKLEYPQVKYAFDVGRPGQGPGDLMYPMSLSVWNDEIAIKESNFFSFFDKSGHFLSKFRAFTNENTFIYQDNKIYWLNPNLKEDHLIEIYLKGGERISTMGKKFIKADVQAFSNPLRVVSLLYEGNIFSDGKSIFYFNSRFGKYFVFSLDGKILSEGDISKSFGERGKKISEYNNDVYIKRTKNEDARSGYPRPVIFDDGYLHKDELYFISSRIISKNGRKTVFELRIFSSKSMSLLDEYEIRKDGVCRLDSLGVIEKNNEALILLGFSVMEEGYYLELYIK